MSQKLLALWNFAPPIAVCPLKYTCDAHSSINDLKFSRILHHITCRIFLCTPTRNFLLHFRLQKFSRKTKVIFPTIRYFTIFGFNTISITIIIYSNLLKIGYRTYSGTNNIIIGKGLANHYFNYMMISKTNKSK